MTLPRALKKTEHERTIKTLNRFSAGAGGGSLLAARPVRAAVRAMSALGVIAIVVHGDDGTVGRPIALIVFWVGAATPANGVDYDLWYPATLP